MEIDPHRFRYHPPPNDEVRIAHEQIRSRTWELAAHFDNQLPSGREKSLAVTKLEEALFWANAAIARNHATFSGP